MAGVIFMKNKGRFFGKYYKISNGIDHSLAVITYIANKREGLMLLTNDKSYDLSLDEIVVNDKEIIFNVNKEDLKIKGTIYRISDIVPKKDIMGIFRYFPIECKHNLYSYLSLINGELLINDKKINYIDGRMYIEGDEGKSFPSKYIWINGLDKDSSYTCSVATIPLFGKTILGFFCYIYTTNKVYKYATYNFAKIRVYDNNRITINKGKYRLEITYVPKIDSAHKLKAPNKGEMSRFIREALTTTSKITLYKKNKIIYFNEYKFTSLERVNFE